MEKEKPLMPMNHCYAEIFDEPHHFKMTNKLFPKELQIEVIGGEFIASNSQICFKPEK